MNTPTKQKPAPAIALHSSAVDAILSDLKDAATLTLQRPKRPEVCSTVCTVVANLIAGCGPHGSYEQKRMMDRCVRFGFHPEYYADTIRVTFIPKE